MSQSKLCVVDTNVAKTANLATLDDEGEDVSFECILACVEAVEHTIKNRSLVLDDGDEIFNEYRGQLALKGQPGVGDRFMKWVHDHRWSLPDSQRVKITPSEDTYIEFPEHDELTEFDRSDRKFVAVANAHSEKPRILQATDSKWWGWKDALAVVGIHTDFVCQDYIQAKFEKKMG